MRGPDAMPPLVAAAPPGGPGGQPACGVHLASHGAPEPDAWQKPEWAPRP